MEQQRKRKNFSFCETRSKPPFHSIPSTFCKAKTNHTQSHTHTHTHNSTENTVKKGSRNILITAALPYVNNSPHLGNLIGAVLSADVYARYCRLRGWNVIYMGGTDEYGTATETTAKKEGMTPRELCDKFHAVHTSVYDWFGIKFDHWGRTSTPQQTEIVQSLFLDLHRNGFIQEDELEQLYCEKCAMFLADRFVEGTCPDCKYAGARGDQCDACGKMIDAVALVSPQCTTCKSAPVKRTSRHLFLDLPKLHAQVAEWKAGRATGWSRNAQAITQALLDKGLERRCITRDLKWGVPVPLPGWEDKVFYVWFDACIGYISITANYTKDWAQWWCTPEYDVELVQFMGKDNVPFHTVIFPATLLGSQRPWTTLRRISTTEYLTYEGGKFSKSRNLGIFGTDAVKEGLAPHVWRYYLLASRPESEDADFTWEDFVSKNNTELVANPGNFVFRVINLVASQYGGEVPAAPVPLEDPTTLEFVQEVEQRLTEYIAHLDALQLRDGLRSAMVVSAACNKYLTKKAPWDLRKTDPAAAAASLYVCVQGCSLVATLLSPFVPTFCDELCRQLQIPLRPLKGPAFSFDVPSGHRIGDNIVPIVQQIDGERILEWWERYGSTQLNSIELEIKVGLISALEPHPQGGNRYVCTVDVGMREKLSIVAALQEKYSVQELLGTKVLIAANLKQQKFGGVVSQGMLLGAEDATGQYGLLRIQDDPSFPCPLGTRCAPDGWSVKPADQFKKVDDFLNQTVPPAKEATPRLFVEEADGTLWWHSVKKAPQFKKQPGKNPKAEGKNKAAAKAAPDARPLEVIPRQLWAIGPGGKLYKVYAERCKGAAKVK